MSHDSFCSRECLLEHNSSRKSKGKERSTTTGAKLKWLQIKTLSKFLVAWNTFDFETSTSANMSNLKGTVYIWSTVPDNVQKSTSLHELLPCVRIELVCSFLLRSKARTKAVCMASPIPPSFAFRFRLLVALLLQTMAYPARIVVLLLLVVLLCAMR